MERTPLEYLISHIREQWLYKNSHFIYPYKFGIEDESLEEDWGEYTCECIIVEKNHESRKEVYQIRDLFDALFVETDRFKFLQSIEAKHKLLQK
ncbi:MAG: hypothetical protein ACOCP4_07295 [Candidatus Woesearchaeota archaeon]